MKILLIEDELAIAKIISSALKYERITVDIARCGNAGLRMAVANKYDLIILDYKLPDKNGDEICLQLRNASFDLPIIVLSAINDYENKVKLLDVGADDYITKPFELAELFARIKAALRKQRIEFGTILSYDDLRLDLKRHSVERQGNKIRLRDKEIKILEYMMRHAEQVLTREMILSYAWGPNTERFTNVVDVHVHNLRDKVDKPFGIHTIQTVNNIGYKLSR
ncbi:MAG: winged helix family two component transcriptional regulator [Candidatus Doudnabacteria bacterium Gr01-1014_77]|uniref:Winged helix family two component transcriptional regulator n=1 Tax=Candidatus Doudnabacteria bacterium Gr01-1014_77 TaxID=2017133 RepID=A0A554JED6_9BACT|nr:MAG: winged helix family two component transcriptional regulator [Candidatus Doudnabacteria bacterium Gr01-1014_77]